MPALANITVKKNDGTTDITYTGITPAGGDSPAVWASQTVGTAQMHQPQLRLSAKTGQDRASVRGTFKYPEIATNTTTGVTSVVKNFDGDFNFRFDRSMKQTDVDEAVSQLANLIASALIKSCAKAGSSAT